MWKNTLLNSWATQWHVSHWMLSMWITLNLDIECKPVGLCVSNTNFLSNHQQIWTHSQDLASVSSVDLTYVYFPLGKQRLSIKSTCVCPTHVKFKERQGRICSVMCWGLQRFVGALHNRKLGTHCLQGLKQQAYPVIPPLWPCDNDGDMWPIIDKRQGRGVFFSFFWGKECQRFWIPSISAPVPLLLRWL